MGRLTTAALFTMIAVAAPVFAAEPSSDAKTVADSARTAETAAADAPQLFRPAAIEPAVRRPAALPMLYGSLAALQMYDGYSTAKGQAHGAREANPMMQWMAASPARFWGVKAATTAASILVAERMWKRNKIGAIATMAVMNGISAAVAARNASVLKQVR